MHAWHIYCITTIAPVICVVPQRETYSTPNQMPQSFKPLPRLTYFWARMWRGIDQTAARATSFVWATTITFGRHH